MYKSIFYILIFFLAQLSGNLHAEVLIGAKAPEFQGVDLNGKPQHLSQYRGNIVVLEWSSPECPYSRRYYENGILDSLYDYAAKNGITWINIVPRLQKLDSGQALEHLDLSKKIVILDNNYAISTAFGAMTTPQVFILDRQGVLVYTGAIDSTATFKKTARAPVPYTRNALDDLMAGRDVAKKITRAFGCYVQNNAVIPGQVIDGLPPIIQTKSGAAGVKESGSQ
ncbi:redoxin domain-containing protein [Kaarinaea lacus]